MLIKVNKQTAAKQEADLVIPTVFLANMLRPSNPLLCPDDTWQRYLQALHHVLDNDYDTVPLHVTLREAIALYTETGFITRDQLTKTLVDIAESTESLIADEFSAGSLFYPSWKCGDAENLFPWIKEMECVIHPAADYEQPFDLEVFLKAKPEKRLRMLEEFFRSIQKATDYEEEELRMGRYTEIEHSPFQKYLKITVTGVFHPQAFIRLTIRQNADTSFSLLWEWNTATTRTDHRFGIPFRIAEARRLDEPEEPTMIPGFNAYTLQITTPPI